MDLEVSLLKGARLENLDRLLRALGVQLPARRRYEDWQRYKLRVARRAFDAIEEDKRRRRLTGSAG